MFKLSFKDKNNKCPICNGNIFKTSNSLNIDKSSKINWISDSSFELSGLNKADSYLTTCYSCFHSVLMPYYDVNKLYSPELGYKVRKKIYENYFPDKVYGQKSRLLNRDKLFSKSAKEVKRFYKNLLLIEKLFKFDKNNFEDFSILDYGGGDGYVSTVYSEIIGIVLNKKVNYYIYDFNKWKNSKGKIFNKKNNSKFQLIILSHVLEHNHNPIKIIRDAIKYADQDAIILIEVPDQRYLFFKGLLGSKFGMDYHVSFFSRKSLTRLLNKCRINIVKTIYDSNSSYRGEDLEAIIAIGRVNNKGRANKSEPSLPFELLSILLSIFAKLKRNIKKRIFTKIEKILKR